MYVCVYGNVYVRVTESVLCVSLKGCVCELCVSMNV